MENTGRIEKLTKILEHQKLILAENLLKVKGEGTIWERKLDDGKRAVSEITGRMIQIEETLKILKTDNKPGGAKNGDNIHKSESPTK